MFFFTFSGACEHNTDCCNHLICIPHVGLQVGRCDTAGLHMMHGG